MSGRWLVTGAGGMLGRDLLGVLAAEGVAATAATRADLDVTDPAAVRAAVRGHDLVVNAAAWTDVDAAERDEAAATAVNGTAVRSLAEACAAGGARLLHVSTDYVFDGTATSPYPEAAPTGPINAYGRGKVAGERAVLESLPDTGYIVRTAWLYGAHGRNFVSTMLRLARELETVEAVADQHGQPTWTRSLAERLAALGRRALAGAAPAGVYHGTQRGQATWYDFAREVFGNAGLAVDRVRPVPLTRFARPARRPAYSVLGHTRWAAAGLDPMPHWKDALRQAFRHHPEVWHGAVSERNVPVKGEASR
ncbi:dTDP-4-dehydrorhamnose reductase [Actinomadura chokoriensis]|uniref:dTDP-4-dehydrorhamnose reductase n=1 Tax=Actinomadura chokoriensis TaxID=454156 RepID=A0ABV4R433_9ACTN